MTHPNALIVDDEPDIRELLEITLGRMGINTKMAEDLETAKALLQQHSFDLCLTDMRLPDGDGIELVKIINQQHPHLPVAVITAHGNMDTAVLALKAGAFDFLSKPVDLHILRQLIETSLKLQPPANIESTQASTTSPIIGISPAIEKVRAMISKLARSQAPIYISGQSGTGKDLAARQIHAQGPRASGEFIAINCGAIPQELMESEFFGHTKGSFTGATADKIGFFEAADGGTLFLDEIADLPLHMQVKLLRAIQEKAIRPVGASKEKNVDIRIISATHKNLSQLVKEGLFRQDLYFRINVIELNLPSLAERIEDIPILAQHILHLQAQRMNITPLPIDSNTLNILSSYPFTGNIRELENILERASALCDGEKITLEDLQLPKTTLQNAIIPNNATLDEQLEELERHVIVNALEETRWNKTAAAEKLGITFRALRYRLNKLKL